MIFNWRICRPNRSCSARISAAASDKIAIYSEGDCTLSKLVGFPNYPTKESLIAFVPNSVEYVSAAVSAATLAMLAAP